MAGEGLLGALLPDENALLAEDPFYLSGVNVLRAPMGRPSNNWEAILMPTLQGLVGGGLTGYGRAGVSDQLETGYDNIMGSLLGDSSYSLQSGFGPVASGDQYGKMVDAGRVEFNPQTAKSQLALALMGREERAKQQGSFADMQDFVQKELIKNQIINAGNEPKRLSELENTTYNRITGAPVTKSYQDIEANFNSLQALAKEDSKTATVGMINALARIWDPGVSVREGDIKINADAQSVLDQTLGDWRGYLTGKSQLSAETKQRMISAAARKYNEFGKQYDAERGLLLDALKRQGGNPENVPTRGFNPYEPPQVGIYAGQQQSGGGQQGIPPGMMLMRNRKTGETKLVPHG